MDKHNRNQSGFSHIFVILFLLVLASIGFAGYRVYSGQQTKSPQNTSGSSQNQQSSEKGGLESFKFTRLPFDAEDIGSVAPVGEFAGITRQTAENSHYGGAMRHYVFSKEPGKRAYNVYAPADATVTAFRNSEMSKQYRFNFSIRGSSAFYFLDHIQSLDPKIEAKLAESFGSPLRYTQAVEQVSKPFDVKAGDIIGQTGIEGVAWDWGLIAPDKCDGILKKDHYHQDMCALSVYDYLPANLQNEIKPLAGYWASPANGGNGLNKVVNGSPLGDYGHDKEDTLSGAWFQKPKGWQNVFITPDPYAENSLQIRLAIPELSVFGVFNKVKIGSGTNNPDPLQVMPKSGIVSYLLTPQNARDTAEYGVLLVRVNDDESITLETIANAQSAPSSPSFTNKAVTIKR